VCDANVHFLDFGCFILSQKNLLSDDFVEYKRKGLSELFDAVLCITIMPNHVHTQICTHTGRHM